MTGEILFLAHRLPFPPDRGDKIRSHHVLKSLAQIAPVHVGCLAENEADETHGAALDGLAATWCMPRRTKPLPLAGLEALWRREPVSLSAFRSRALSAWVEATLRNRQISAIYVFSGQMGQYVPPGWNGRLVVDLVDVDSAKFEAYARAGRGPRAWVDQREGRLLRVLEAELASRADTTLLVSEAEADLLRRRTGLSADIRAMGNGIDCGLFDPAAVSPTGDLTAEGPHYVFTGQMDYPPNIAAVTRMTHRIMPEIRKTLPLAAFHIVGRAPAREVRALEGMNGTNVVGEVADTRPWLAAADAIVAPLALARGVQNKVLEAMAMARPVVLSPGAATGIDGCDGTHFLIAEDDDAFVRHLLRLSHSRRDADTMGHEARRLVTESMSWPAMLSPLPHLLGFSSGARRDAA